MAFTKITAAGIGTTESVTLDGLSVINNGSFGGNLTVGGVLTYEDVTNVDSVGLITARNGIVVGSGITLSKDGDIFATGITTVSGNVKVGTGITLSPDGDVFFTGVGTGNGSGLTALNASNLASGTVPTARLGSGTASSSTFLRGDSTFQTVTTDLVADTSPQLGGALDTNSNNIDFGTNDKAIFGDNDQLKIYYDGSNSVVTASSNGDLTLISTYDDVLVQAADNIFIRPQGGEEGIKVMGDGAVELYHDNSKRFETDSSGTTTTGRAYITGTILQGTTDAGESNGDEATFANTGGNAGITIRSAVDAETKIYFSEGTSGGSQYRGAINYNHNTNYMAFSANETEKIRILSTGGITFNGDTAAANALDDYEEGSWTFGVSFGGGTTGLSYSSQQGHYTKIGNIVYLKGHLMISTRGSSTGHARITGLPYQATGSPSNFTPLPDRGTVNLGTGAVGMAAFLNGDSSPYLYAYKFNGEGNYAVQHGSFTTNSELNVNFVYRTT